MYANRQVQANAVGLEKNIEKLSSGERINRAGDDASGLAVSEKMRSQVRGLNMAAKNAQDGISFIQTSEGYLQNIQDMLQRTRELAIQSSNGVYTAEDRMQIQVEVSQLIDEIDRIASTAQFNGLNMLTGRFASAGSTDNAQGTVVSGQNAMWFHLGANMDQRERAFIGTMTSVSLGLSATDGGAKEGKQVLTLSTPESANVAIGKLDEALQKVNKQRADLGAYQNRMEFAVKGILVGAENLQAAESRIRDTDMASMSADFVKNQVLTQSSVAMLSQANMKSQAVLRLLQ